MKRKPPVQNVRRVSAIGDNLRHTVTSKTQRSIQCESFHEYKLVLRLDRDPTVADYLSQPETLTYTDEHGKSHRYTPDFKVWRTNGHIELHEVTLESRRQTGSPPREQAAQVICAARGWSYHVHTDTTLPTGGELANLMLLFGYRPQGYANPTITQALKDALVPGQRWRLQDMVDHLVHQLVLPIHMVLPPLLHLVWHDQLRTDLDTLLCIAAAPNRAAHIWLPVEDHDER
jgi:hypothetical protein